MWKWKKSKQRTVKAIICLAVLILVTAATCLYARPDIADDSDIEYEEVKITGPVLDLGDGYYTSPADVTQEDLDNYVPHSQKNK